MTLYRKVAEAIAERGQGSLDDLAPLFPEYSRKQVHRAIDNARLFGLINLIGHAETRTRGVGHGIYAPYGQAKPVQPIAVSSVFDLGRLALHG